MRIREIQKHTDPTDPDADLDPDPQPCLLPSCNFFVEKKCFFVEGVVGLELQHFFISRVTKYSFKIFFTFGHFTLVIQYMFLIF